PTNGNAGAAMAAYAARAGLEAFCFCPDDTPEINLSEIALQGAAVWRVNGLINDCARLVESGKAKFGWFDMSTLKEPYRIEGKKTMGLELAAQTDWQLPDVVFYPTGGGTGLIGMWKAWAELTALGWISPPLPRLVAVQATGCAPIVRAFESGASAATAWENARTIAAGIRVPAALGDFLILEALRESGGFALAVSDSAIEAARQQVGLRDGLLLSPEGAATYAAYLEAAAGGRLRASDHVVLFNCASGLKYPMPAVTARMDVRAPFAAGISLPSPGSLADLPPADGGCADPLRRKWRWRAPARPRVSPSRRPRTAGIPRAADAPRRRAPPPCAAADSRESSTARCGRPSR